MRLQIFNFAKIRHADIKVDGLTVICGLNNSGKSTVGKALHSVFNSLHGIDKAISDQRHDFLLDEAASVLRTVRNDREARFMVPLRRLSRHLAYAVNDLCQNGAVPDYEGILDKVREVLAEQSERYQLDVEAICQPMAQALHEIACLPVEKVMNSYVSSYFDRMFGGQINSIQDDDTTARLGLGIRHNEIQLTFEQDRCTSVLCPIELEHRSIYIDNPYVVDKLCQDESDFDDDVVRPAEKELYDKLSQYSKIMQSGDVAYKKTMVAEMLSEVETMLDSVIQGKIEKTNEGLAIASKAGGKPLLLKNASLGIKSFSILYMLLESLQLKKKDVLILDEPEIHLHTQWQLVYAEIIVLLQKLFDLSVVITTHSPFFSDAIDVFSAVHGTRENTSFYLSKSDGPHAELADVSHNVGLIYDIITPALAKLKELRYNVNNPSPEE